VIEVIQRRRAGADEGLRSAYLYSREKQKGRRHWQGKGEQKQVVYQNRERVRGENGKSLLRRRGEFVERSFVHCYETDARGNERWFTANARIKAQAASLSPSWQTSSASSRGIGWHSN
jgi:hypothetical protein